MVDGHSCGGTNTLGLTFTLRNMFGLNWVKWSLFQSCIWIDSYILSYSHLDITEMAALDMGLGLVKCAKLSLLLD